MSAPADVRGVCQKGNMLAKCNIYAYICLVYVRLVIIGLSMPRRAQVLNSSRYQVPQDIVLFYFAFFGSCFSLIVAL